MHPYQRQIDLCGEALKAIRSSIPRDLFRDVDEYIKRSDEWGLGMEVLIDQLAELDIAISPEQFDLIRAAMDSMGRARATESPTSGATAYLARKPDRRIARRPYCLFETVETWATRGGR